MSQLCKVRLESGEIRPAILDGEKLQPLTSGRPTLTDLLHGADPLGQALKHVDAALGVLPLHRAMLVAPIDQQEVWAAGVTYKRSEEARKRESVGAAQFYDLVYSADRPELFFKSPAWRVSGPGERVHIRRDARWSVPEPELALVISPELKLVGFTIGNDMSSRDIEGENPLYLPQAKFYDHACALGPAITLVADMPSPDAAVIRVTIERSGANVFEGDTKVSAIKRSFEELIGWLGRETSFPHGAILLTGTGIVPADTFTLAVGDIVHIDVTGIGRLTNVVQQKS
jgi:2-dehydro-3-deoxy-D-arabinonate dehydratase